MLLSCRSHPYPRPARSLRYSPLAKDEGYGWHCLVNHHAAVSADHGKRRHRSCLSIALRREAPVKTGSDGSTLGASGAAAARNCRPHRSTHDTAHCLRIDAGIRVRISRHAQIVEGLLRSAIKAVVHSEVWAVWWWY